MQDLVISAVSEYQIGNIKRWVNSLEKSGYDGAKTVIGFNILDVTVEYLEDHGFWVFVANKNRNKDDDGFHFADKCTYQVPMLRHYFYWRFLSQMTGIRNVISTDISDVVFQTNPSEWLEKNFCDEYDLMYQCEGLRYKDEAWGRDNMKNCYGEDVYQVMSERPIYNAGSMAGRWKTFVDFSLNASLVSMQAQHNPTPDQAAVNLLLSLEPYNSITQFNDHDINWACEAGTVADPKKIDGFRPNLLSPEPTFDGDFVYNSKGEKYCMVHQYNRVPNWKSSIEKKYE